MGPDRPTAGFALHAPIKDVLNKKYFGFVRTNFALVFLFMKLYGPRRFLVLAPKKQFYTFGIEDRVIANLPAGTANVASIRARRRDTKYY